jgi:transposase
MAKVEFDDLMSVGIDIGKDTFHIVGFDHDGQRVLRKQIKRLALVTRRLKSCGVVLSAWRRV